MNYDAKYFLNKFEAIPEERWTTGSYNNGHGQSCALGHCFEWGQFFSKVMPDKDQLVKLFEHHNMNIIDANDGNYNGGDITYCEFGDSPKERVINALALIDSGILEDL